MKFTVLAGDSFSGPYETTYFEADTIYDVYKYLMNNYVHPIDNDEIGHIIQYHKNEFIGKLREYYSSNDISPFEKIVEMLSKLDHSEIKNAVRKLNIKDNLTDLDIKTLFEFCFTPGEGVQEGIPVKEWHYIKVEPYEESEPEFIKIN